jgi:hypothetical protein
VVTKTGAGCTSGACSPVQNMAFPGRACSRKGGSSGGQRATVGLACAKSNFPPDLPKQLQLACPGLIWTWMWAGALKNEFLAPPPFPVGALSTAPVGLATRNCFSGLATRNYFSGLGYTELFLGTGGASQLLENRRVPGAGTPGSIAELQGAGWAEMY